MVGGRAVWAEAGRRRRFTGGGGSVEGGRDADVGGVEVAESLPARPRAPNPTWSELPAAPVALQEICYLKTIYIGHGMVVVSSSMTFL